jgi:hypothetical protein
MSHDCHLGTRLMSAATFLGCAWVALVPAGLLVRRRFAGPRSPSPCCPCPGLALASNPARRPPRPTPPAFQPLPQTTLATLMGPSPETPASLALYGTLGPAIIALLLVNRVPGPDAPPMLWAKGMNWCGGAERAGTGR